MTALIACQTDMKTCPAQLQLDLFQNFFALMISYIHGSMITTPFFTMDKSPEARLKSYAGDEDGSISMSIILVYF